MIRDINIKNPSYVAFKFKARRRLRESIMEGQDSFIMREPEDAEVEFGEDGKDVVHS